MRKHLNFIVLLTLFFGWGFVTCLNDLLTPILKEIFALNNFEANLVSFVFFAAYFIGSLFYVMSSIFGLSFFSRLGYKGLLLLGLMLSAVGFLVFVPAALFQSHVLFLCGLFLIGFGFTFIQISANPLAIISGSEATGASRLNLAQGFNSLAYTVAPIIGGYVFYTLLDVHNKHNNLAYPYIFLFLSFLALLAVVYMFLRPFEESSFNPDESKPFALNHVNLLFGMVAIFCYVGAEVSIGTNLIAYLRSAATVNLTDATASKLLAFYWGGAMIGRFLGGLALSSVKGPKKLVLMVIIAAVLTALIVFTTNIYNLSLHYFIIFQIIAIILFMYCHTSRLNLVLFSIVNIINLIIGANMHNSWFAVWAVLSIGVFNSVMWSNIFDLAISGLGKYKEQASSFLVMMIFGGAVLPMLQGYVADKVDITASFFVPIICYLYILGYSIFYSKKKLNMIKSSD